MKKTLLSEPIRLHTVSIIERLNVGLEPNNVKELCTCLMREYENIEQNILGIIELANSKVIFEKKVGFNDFFIEKLKESYEFIFEKNRQKDKIYLRFAVWYILKENGTILQKIGDYFGKDHSTIPYGIKVIKNSIFTKDELVLKDYYEMNQFYEKVFKIYNKKMKRSVF